MSTTIFFFKKKLNYKSLRVTGRRPLVLEMWIWSLFGSINTLGFDKLHGLLFDCLDALRGAVLLLVLQVALEEEFDLFHRNTQMDHAIKKLPARDKWSYFKISL